MNSTIALNKLTGFASAGSAVLKKVAAPLWKALTFSLADERIFPSKVLAASLEKGVLSVAYGSRFLSRIRIRGVREYSFDADKYPQPEVFASSLALAINDLGASKSMISLSIPKAWAIINTVEFPSAVKENLADVISYELDRISPFNSEDAFYDFKVLDENEGRLSVTIAVARADAVRPYSEALGDRGLSVDRITVNLSGFETLCRYLDGGAEGVFVEISPEGYEGAVFTGGSIADPFSGSFSGADEKSKADAVRGEISPLMDKLKDQGKIPQVTVLLKDTNPELKESLTTGLGQPVTILNEKDEKIRLPGQDTMPHAAVGALLEVLWLKVKGFNLLAKGRHERAKSPKGLTIALLIAIAAMWGVYLIAPLKIEEKRLAEIDRQIALRKDEVRKVEALRKETDSLNKEITTITDFKGNGPMALNIIKELTTILPKSAWLSRLRITQTTVDVEGYASSATGLLPKLEASPYFRKAEFASPTFRDTRMNSDRFNIKMEIEGAKTEGKKKEGTDDAEEE